MYHYAPCFTHLTTPGNLLPSLLILLPRLLNNIVTDNNPFFPLQTLLNEPIPQELLIKTLLTTTDLVSILRPEPG